MLLLLNCCENLDIPDVMRLVIVPICIVWGLYAYLVYSFVLGVMYYRRRAESWLKRSEFTTGAALIQDDTSQGATPPRIVPKTTSNSSTPLSFIRQLETVDEERSHPTEL
ncbi:unnamed protein product [Caenorhabditis bovis]|uniref:Uncharacterized protein n=1 Tax=Caenorhabditis bovis TaxID=2654633 RepID=A0A8S1FAU7_9PELO|nr:unnamed protein product [Caenorhabditis bovis]